MVTLPDGRTYFVYWTGNQGRPTPPNNIHMSFQAAGLVNGTQQQWLESYFGATTSKGTSTRSTAV